MLLTATVVRKLNLPTVASKLKILSVSSKNFSSSTGYSEEELEKFRKVFRTVHSYEESIAAKDVEPYLRSIGFIKPQETYDKYTEFVNKEMGGRLGSNLFFKCLRIQHDSNQWMHEIAIFIDKDKDGYISKEEFDSGIELLKFHDPRTKNISFEAFLKEADVNKDGRISISELKDWLNKNLPSK